ncbi:MAG: hypothetical protein WCT52_03760 [Candidatus Micrarchaeia archaeon]
MTTAFGLNIKSMRSAGGAQLLAEKTTAEFYSNKIAGLSQTRYNLSRFFRAMKAFKGVECHVEGAWNYSGQFDVGAGVNGIQADRLKKKASTTIATDWAGIEPQLDGKVQWHSNASKATTMGILVGLAASCLSIDALSTAQSNILITLGMLVTGASMFAKGVFSALSNKYAALKNQFAAVSKLATQEAH